MTHPRSGDVYVWDMEDQTTDTIFTENKPRHLVLSKRPAGDEDGGVRPRDVQTFVAVRISMATVPPR